MSADAIAPLLRRLLGGIYDYELLRSDGFYMKAHESMSTVLESSRDLMKCLSSMMLGYENEEVKALLYGIERELDRVGRSSFGVGDRIHENCEKLIAVRYGSNIDGEETVVGFDEEVETLLDQLTATYTKQLQILSIAGMAGIGKTTLARKLYMDPLIEYMFDFRAWICVSQTYLKRDLLLSILSCFINNVTDETYNSNDEQLGEKLYRLLKGRKYLVVLDDIWDGKAWSDLRTYFPDDNVGSRVLSTSRDTEICSHLQAGKPTHVLRLRTEDESFAIFVKKVFRTGVCEPRLEEVGKVLIRKCEGLPLAIVIVAGLLKGNWSAEWWFEISESLHSFVASDPSQYMDSVALSYNHLPPHLRQCFLFVAVFPEDYDIPVIKLIWLWIAQGLIHQKTQGRIIIEDVAEDFLRSLVNRGLLMTAKTGADGRFKTCRVHDLLRDLCLKKANEETYSDGSVSLNPPASPANFLYPFELGEFLQKGQSFDIERYKTLRILDMESVLISLFPSDVVKLVNLRYLAIQARDGSPNASISSLVNLQMLIILSRKNIVLPKTIWLMVNLRHLFMKSGENLIEDPVQGTEKDDCPSGLACLQTLSQVCPQSCKNIFSRTLNLRKLGICGPLVSTQGELQLPNLLPLQYLQKLKLLNTIPHTKPTGFLNTVMFPPQLKKLTLSNTCMDWRDIWTVSLLPNLEVLKLKFHACLGETWETGDAGFTQLKILKLHGLNLRKWVCFRENFPVLQRLVLRQCLNLESIPSDLGRIITLEVIEIQWCTNSALEIQKEQAREGNCFLKVHATNNH